MRGKIVTSNTVKTYWIKIYLSGPYAIAEQVCREYCLEVGLCVTIDKTKYIYTGGEEEGFVVGMINYPRFPSDELELNYKADELAKRLLKATAQHSYLKMDPINTVWYTVRKQ